MDREMKWPGHQHDWRIVDSGAYIRSSLSENLKQNIGFEFTRVLYRCAGCRKFRVECLDGSWAIARDGDAEEATLKKIVGTK